MPAKMGFRGRSSHSQLSVHSLDKPWCVIAALVMLANKGTAVQAEYWQWRAERSSPVLHTSFPHQPPALAQQVWWRTQAGSLCSLSPSLHCTIGLSGWVAATSDPLASRRQWAQVLLHHLPSTEGTEMGLHIETVAVSMLPWFWSKTEEEQRG